MKKRFLAFLLLGILIFLLLFPEAALFASRRGLDLWFGTLVPTLLPFLILSGFLIHSGLVQIPAALLAPVFGRLFGISPLGSYACFTGFLCGCPMGAKVTGDLLSQNLICEEEAGYLVSFVNNLSPAFIISFAVHQNLGIPSLTGPPLCILYGAPLLWALLCRIRRRRLSRQERAGVSIGPSDSSSAYRWRHWSQ